MPKLKQTYDTKNKKTIRDFLLQNFKFKSVIGLAGPDIEEYITYLKKKGYKNFEIYENSPNVLVKQLIALKTENNLSLIYEDILKADANKSNVLYDLDFCGSVRYLQEHIAKFKNNFIMTFSSRIGIQETIDTFFQARKEQIISQIDKETPIKQTLIQTNNGNYSFIRYYDTSAMCCFAKF